MGEWWWWQNMEVSSSISLSPFEGVEWYLTFLWRGSLIPSRDFSFNWCFFRTYLFRGWEYRTKNCALVQQNKNFVSMINNSLDRLNHCHNHHGFRSGIVGFHLVFSGSVALIGSYYTSIIVMMTMMMIMMIMKATIVVLMFRTFAHYLVYSDDAMVRFKELSIPLIQFKFRYFYA